MSWLPIIVLGIVQGVTEFLPVSSTGHLVVVQNLLVVLGEKELPDATLVNILLHAGTLAAILVFYWKRIWRLFGEDRRVIGLILVGSIPAGVVGIAINKTLPDEYQQGILENPLLAGVCFLLTAVLLIWSGRHEPGETDYQQVSYRDALIIGLFQAIAILPGISRSGSTIAAGLLVGLRREAAATFAFLLAIPAIGGATAIALWELVKTNSATNANIPLLAAGTLVSFLVGLTCLAWLINWVRRGRLHYFAYWLVPLGIVVILWQLAS